MRLAAAPLCPSSSRRWSACRGGIAVTAALSLAMLTGCRFSDIPGFEQPRIPLDTTTPPVPQDVAAWLRDSSTALRSVAFDDTDWSDLAAVGAAIGQRRVVLLGEQSGGDGTTLQAKARLVRYLHEVLGFDALVFEAGAYDLYAAAEQLAATNAPATVMRAALPDPWRRSAELGALFTWLGERARTARPLRVAGIDPRFSGVAQALAARPLGLALEAYLERHDSPLLADPEWPMLRDALDAIASEGDANPRASGAVRTALEQGLPRLRAETNRLVNVAPEADAAFWRLVVSGLGVREAWAQRRDAGHADTAETLRQAEMADALVSQVQSVFAGTRVIVWTNSAAAMRVSSELVTVTGTLIVPEVINFGERARTIIGDEEVYALAFLAGEGSYGPFATGAAERTLVRPTPESWDGLFRSTGYPVAFLHLRRPPTADNVWLYGRRVARALGYQQVAARWPLVFDGFLFTAGMAPIAPSP